jgi:hypothetical protein
MKDLKVSKGLWRKRKDDGRGRMGTGLACFIKDARRWDTFKRERQDERGFMM